MAKPRSLRPKDRALAVEAAAIAASTWFVVNWFVGRRDGVPLTTRALWERADFRASDYGGDRNLALAAARFAVAERGYDEHQRRGMLYAVSASGISLFVE